MRLLVAIDGHFLSVGDDVFSLHLTYERFWKRYLQVFDSVLVVARVKSVETVPPGWQKATGPNVAFCAIPDHRGPWQYLRVYPQLNVLVRQVLYEADAYILRVPGIIATSLWRFLMKNKIPYAVEVVGDPWDSLAPGSVKNLGRPFFRWQLTRNLKKQCQKAAAAAYVTEYSLQKRYPPGGWTTYCSDVELPDDAIVDESAIEARVERIKAKAEFGRPWRLCYVGSMSQLYKAPDILIEAVAKCVKKGVKLKLIMVGEGQFRPQLEQQAQRLGIADYVQFLGRLPAGKDIFDQLDVADIFVLASRQEGLPRAMVEAMARGLPCIGSNVGGIPELLASEDLVPPGDVETLAVKITSLIRNPDTLIKMMHRNLQAVRNYRADELNWRRIEFYKKVRDGVNTRHTKQNES